MNKKILGDLKELLEKYEDVKWNCKKDLKTSIMTINQYVEFAENNVISVFEDEYARMSNKISSYKSDNFLNQDIAKTIIDILRKLIPIYIDVSKLVVNQKCEKIQNDLIKELKKILDDIVDIAYAFCPKPNFSLSKEQIFEIAQINLKYANNRFMTVKVALKQTLNREKTSEFKKEKINWTKFINNNLPKLLLFIVILLILLHKFGSQNVINVIDNYMKVLGWLIIILWIPFWFLRTLLNKLKPLIPIISSAILLIWFSYGFLKGLTLLIVLVVYPVFKLLSQDTITLERSNTNMRKVLFLPTNISLIITFIITREPIWILGSTIWIIWSFISFISFRYFRPVFSSLSKQDTENGELIIDSWVFMAILVSTIIIVPGILRSIPNNLINNLYLTSIQIALTLIGFLLTIQSLISNAALKSQEPKEKVFEMEMISKSLDALKGYMLIFLSLFIISILGYLSTKMQNDLRFVSDWLTKSINIDKTNIILIIKSILFTGYVTILSFSIAYLHYLFLSTNLISMPFKTILLSKPIIIEKFTNLTSDLTLGEDIKQLFFNEHKLNGKVFSEIIINNLEDGLYASCLMEVMFPDKIQLMNIAKIIGESLITKRNFTRVCFWVKAKQGTLGLMKIFQVELDEEKLEFLFKDDDGLEIEYKFIQIGTYFWSSAYKESQIM